MVNIALIGTFDTKGPEYEYFGGKLREHGASVVRMDLSVMGEGDRTADYPADLVARAGGTERSELQRQGDRESAQTVMARGAAGLIMELYGQGKIQGIAAMGGGQGVSMLSRVYQELPIGFPKLLLSPLASLPGKMGMFQGIHDTITMNTIVDIAGLNHILCQAMETGAAAITAAAREYARRPPRREKPVVGISMFGITTKCVNEMERILTEHGYEVLVFHTNGAGGRLLEKMVRDGVIGAVADITTSEVGQNLLGGSCDAGPERMEAMVELGIPYLVSTGALDVVNFVPQAPIPEQYRGRNFHMHGMAARVMRTSKEENRLIAAEIAKKLNRSKRPERIEVLLPLKGISANDVPGNACFDLQADAALFEGLTASLRPEIRVTRALWHINDREFAALAADRMMRLYPAGRAE